MPTEDLPLPTLEEVLFCDSKTTSEEVGLSVYKLHGCSTDDTVQGFPVHDSHLDAV